MEGAPQIDDLFANEAEREALENKLAELSRKKEELSDRAASLYAELEDAPNREGGAGEGRRKKKKDLESLEGEIGEMDQTISEVESYISKIEEAFVTEQDLENIRALISGE